MSEADPGAMIAGASAPYPGLRPFEPHEWAIFCGRERTTLDVIARLGERNLVFVHGGSGCGKSSLVRAGVLPAIDRDHRLAGRRFEHAIIRPSEGPLTALDRVLTERLGECEGGWAQALIFPDTVVDRIEAACAASGIETLCLVVDQFEEAFRWARESGPEDIQLLTDFLGRVAACTTSRRFFVLTTMRSDYLGDCAQFPGLSTIINDCQFFLPNLDDRGLLRSIVDPARQFGGRVDEVLANRLRFAASGERDPLPTMQHLLMRMAERKRAIGRPWIIDVDDLAIAQRGGAALSVHADELFAAAAADDPQVEMGMAWLFRALVDRDVGGRGIRRPCSAGELSAVSGLSDEQLDRVLAIFSAERANLLVVSDPGEGPAGRRVDISHEALIRNWRRMTSADGQAGWLARELDDGLIWRMLAVSARTPNALLDAATLLEREAWIEPFIAHPARARRYLIRPQSKTSVEEEPEWQSVQALLARSRLRYEEDLAHQREVARGMRILLWLGLGIAVLLLGSAALWLQYRKRDNQEQAGKVASALIQGSLDADDKLNPVDAARKDTISDAALETLAPVLNTTAATDGGDGFVWIGSGRVTYLKAPGPGGARVMPADVTPGTRYETRYNIVLRKGPPLAGNVTQAAINVVPSGSLVIAVSAPRPARASTGVQYWLEIRDIRPPATQPASKAAGASISPKPRALRVYPHFGVENLEVADTLTSGLAQRGYNVMGTQVLAQAQGFREIRYCHASDEAAADKLVDDFYDILPTRAIIKARKLNSGCGKTALGTLELWLGNP